MVLARPTRDWQLGGTHILQSARAATSNFTQEIHYFLFVWFLFFLDRFVRPGIVPGVRLCVGHQLGVIAVHLKGSDANLLAASTAAAAGVAPVFPLQVKVALHVDAVRQVGRVVAALGAVVGVARVGLGVVSLVASDDEGVACRETGADDTNSHFGVSMIWSAFALSF